jgi:hypothetical protein
MLPSSALILVPMRSLYAALVSQHTVSTATCQMLMDALAQPVKLTRVREGNHRIVRMCFEVSRSLGVESSLERVDLESTIALTVNVQSS